MKDCFSKLEIAKQEFYAIIDQIIEQADDDDFFDHTQEVEDIKDRFYDYRTKQSKTALALIYKNVVDDNNIEGSTANFEQIVINQITFLDKLSAIESKPIC